MMFRKTRAVWFAGLITLALCTAMRSAQAELRAGAVAIDITPAQLPVVVNGGFLTQTADAVHTRLHARALVLDDGDVRLAIVVVDSCALPRRLIDEAKQLAARRTKIPVDCMLISATHTHTAPSSIGGLGTDVDPNYPPFLRIKLAEAVAAAESNLEPARVGWAVGHAPEFTALRRWIHRSDRIGDDPFGNPTVRATMHSGRNWDIVTGVSGPEDPDLSLISVQATDGRPIALLANFSMHYYAGETQISADYYGLFSEGLKQRIGREDSSAPAFVGMMSHGCSGDAWRHDYSLPAELRDPHPTIEGYTQGLLDIAMAAYETMDYAEDVDLAMAEERFDLPLRVPDAQRLDWARRIMNEVGDRPPENQTEVYAREQIYLHDRQSSEIVVQAVRIGDIGIATTPTETYALTGLKIKMQSPLANTMVLDLANGSEGYIPSPEQHLLGGYNTWAARSAGLEVEAEPKITESALRSLEQVSGSPRRAFRQSQGEACQKLLAADPRAYWRLDEYERSLARDASGNGHNAIYEPGVVFFLDGPSSDAFCSGGESNRAAHFAGGRLRAQVSGLGDQYSVSLWFWNGMPTEGRGVTGWLFSRDRDHAVGPQGDHLGIGGTASEPGKLVFQHGADAEPSGLIVGNSEIQRWTWNHVLLVRDGDQVRVYLNGNAVPEIETTARAELPAHFDQLFFGGRGDSRDNWEGRLDEIAVFDRVVTPEEIK